ncbi:MAG: hypothetical protein GKR92_03910 [Gammaproteobacteria bacterium]|nr:MAG: hypothetical protein GKR92_03910 [Gammaproteobacteria bacterium]
MPKLKQLRLLGYLLIVIVITACSHVPTPENIDSEVEDFTQAINALSAEVLVTDASQTSRVLISTAIVLADEYDMASPALYHNMLVNTGFRQRGLCCHWAEDLHTKLRELHTSSLKFDWLVARLGSQLREHNTVVIYAAESNWSEGIVFDPWRKAGVPYWIKVADDDYAWQPHPLSGQWNVLRCK